MNNQGMIGAIIIIIIVLAMMGGAVVLVIVLKDKYDTPETEQNVTEMMLLIQSRDGSSKAPIGVSYELYDPNNTLVSSGELESSEIREIEVDPIPYELICWSENYYLAKKEISPRPLDITDGVIQATCEPGKIGDLEITHHNEIVHKTSLINLSLTSEERFQKPLICMGWSSGFISARLQEEFIICETASWLNYTYHNVTSQTFDYLPEGEYVCSGRIEKCKSAVANRCEKPEEKIPIRLRHLVDRCYYVGKDIKEETVQVPILVELAEYTNRFDKIDFYVVDKDKRRLPDGTYQLFTEYDNRNIGTEDYLYSINYKGGE